VDRDLSTTDLAELRRQIKAAGDDLGEAESTEKISALLRILEDSLFRLDRESNLAELAMLGESRYINRYRKKKQGAQRKEANTNQQSILQIADELEAQLVAEGDKNLQLIIDNLNDLLASLKLSYLNVLLGKGR